MAIMYFEWQLGKRGLNMRVFMIITVLALLTVMPVVHAQENDLPTCSTAELAAMHASSGEIAEFFRSATSIRTMNDLLAYS